MCANCGCKRMEEAKNLLYIHAKNIRMEEAKKIREKIREGEFKTVKKEGRSAVWERFSEVLNREDESVGYVICNSCEALYVYDSHKTGTSNMVHHTCGKARTRGDSRRSLDVQPKLVDDCSIDVRGLDMRPFDMVTAQTFINIGAKYGAVAVDAGIIPHRKSVCDNCVSEQESTADDDEESPSPEQGDEGPSTSESRAVSPHIIQPSSSSSSSSVQQRKKKRKAVDDIADVAVVKREAAGLDERREERVQNMDEDFRFTETVRDMLRKLPARMKSQAKFKIHQMLHEMEQSLYTDT